MTSVHEKCNTIKRTDPTKFNIQNQNPRICGVQVPLLGAHMKEDCLVDWNQRIATVITKNEGLSTIILQFSIRFSLG